jgi:riboflavin kinase/FMN adenylyltransferase
MISSTFIRKKIRAGKIMEINKLLNRRWCIEGRVIKGKKRGRKIGFPTCNMDLSNYVIPKIGVYAVKVNFGKLNKDGIANIGFRPTFKGQSLLLETNIFGINKNLYNKVLSISFKKFIRPEKKFRNFEYLRKQIKLDIKQAKK